MKNEKSKKRKVETRELSALKSFPTQEKVFPACSDDENSDLTDDIRNRGLQQLMHVLPENSAGYAADTILSGHRRRDVLLSLGEKTARVVVRYDLADADAAMIELAFLNENDQRRHLSPLGKARVVLRRFEIERSRRRRAPKPGEETEVRERVGKAIGMCGRNVHRYVKIARAPQSLQRAFEDGPLTLEQAARLAGLPADVVTEIDEKLKAGADPRNLPNTYLGKPRRRGTDRGTEVTQFIATVGKATQKLREHDLAGLRMPPSGGELRALHDANKACVELIRLLKQSREQRRKLIDAARRLRKK